MNEDTIRWMVGQGLVLSGIIVSAYIRTIVSQNKLEGRITRLEVLVGLITPKIMKAVHSPTNHHGLDPLLDKYISGQDLSMKEWEELLRKAELVLNNPNSTVGEKLGHGWMAGFAEHKLLCHNPQLYKDYVKKMQ